MFIDQKKLGILDLELYDFLSENVIKREYFKFFSGKDLKPILSWGMNVIIIINLKNKILKIKRLH